MQNVYKNIEEQNSSRRCNVLIFDDMIADMISNKNPSSIVTEFLLEEES